MIKTAFKTAAQRKAYWAKHPRPRGKLIARKKQKRTYWLKDTQTGEFEGRDADSKHPKGTMGRKDNTLFRQDKRGWGFGRTED